MARIEARRAVVHEVQSKTEMIANLLEDIGANLDTVAAQKAQIEHVSDQMARLEFSVQQSQHDTALHQERERAERGRSHPSAPTRERSTRPADTAMTDSIMSSWTALRAPRATRSGTSAIPTPVLSGVVRSPGSPT